MFDRLIKPKLDFKPWRSDTQESVSSRTRLWPARSNTSTLSQDTSDWETSSLEKSLQKPLKKARFHSWQVSLTSWICLTVVTLLINVSLTIAVAARSGFRDGLGELMMGDCVETQRLNTAAHLLINVLSTCLLAGSNYCMQCLCAPTRSEVDRGHSNGVALDIGTPSFRNFRFMKKRKFAAWFLFALSSLPLHLFYNSVVYASIEHNNYSAVIANGEFIDTDRSFGNYSVNLTSSSPYLMQEYDLKATSSHNDGYTMAVTQKINNIRSFFQDGQLERLEPPDCARAYGQDFVSAYGNIVVVPRSDELDRGIIYAEQAARMRWMCGQGTPEMECPFITPQMIDNPGEYFRPFDLHVDHCMAQPTEQMCKLYFDLTIAIIVIVFNATKIALMFVVARYVDMKPFLTIGDALMSYLKTPDAWTNGNCLYNASDFRRNRDPKPSRNVSRARSPWTPDPLAWSDKRQRWIRAPGLARWIQFLIPFFAVYITTIYLMADGMRVISSRLPSVTYAFELGIGSTRSVTVIAAFGQAGSILLANLPQLILSMIYFAYNAILTIMLTGKEWTELAQRRKGLRVSRKPRGQQRATYFLQLPYRYSAPLLIASGFLHWLVAESLHLVAMAQRWLDSRGRLLSLASIGAGDMARDGGGDDISGSGATIELTYAVAWSPLAVLLVLVLGALMFLALLLLAARRYRSGMPLGGNNSLVLAAACHPDAGEAEGPELAYCRLKWGVVGSCEIEGESDVGHCALSSKGGMYPVKGKMYA